MKYDIFNNIHFFHNPKKYLIRLFKEFGERLDLYLLEDLRFYEVRCVWEIVGEVFEEIIGKEGVLDILEGETDRFYSIIIII